MKFRIGVDGGGTTTRAVVIDEKLNVLGRGEAGPGNFYSAGEGAAVANIVAAISAAIANAGVAPGEICSWGLGLAGACSEADKAAQREALLPHAHGAKVLVDEDAPAAQAGAFAGGPGAICIAGTGANCFGVNEKGERRGADGFGPLLGDRGSGYWCGEQALRAACASADGSGSRSALHEAVFQHFGAADVFELIEIVYAPDFKKDRIAALVPTILQVAEGGDSVAEMILVRAGEQLAFTTMAVLRPLGINKVAPLGGLLANDTKVRATYEFTLRHTFPGTGIVAPMHDAAVGAGLLGRVG